MASVTLANLRQQCQEFFDQEGTSPVSDARWNRTINWSARQYWSKLAVTVPDRLTSRSTITATGAEKYALPADWMETRVIFPQDSGGAWDRPLERAQVHERWQWDRSTAGDAEAFYVENGYVYLLPWATSGTYIHLYIPTFTELSGDSSTILDVNGWAQWVVLTSLIKEAHSESDGAALQRIVGMRRELEREMASWTDDAHSAHPQRVQVTRPYGSRRGWTLRSPRP